jgi:hypothetical protein
MASTSSLGFRTAWILGLSWKVCRSRLRKKKAMIMGLNEDMAGRDEELRVAREKPRKMREEIWGLTEVKKLKEESKLLEDTLKAAKVMNEILTDWKKEALEKIVGRLDFD